jgi:hypothetical protein
MVKTPPSPLTEKIEGIHEEDIEHDINKERAPPSTQPMPEELEEPLEGKEESMASIKSLNKVFRRTVGNLIKVARTLDSEGNSNGAEEIHAIIRKYQKRLG